ncbi:MAG: cadherin-like beta sandwich domain-containing protein [Myxococcota bacterium]
MDFFPSMLEYEAGVSIVQDSVTIIASVASPNVTITVEGSEAISGIPAQPVSLNLGSNQINIVLNHPLGFWA